MHPKVKQYLEEQERKEQSAKNELLMKLGLVEKKYYESREQAPADVISGYDVETGKPRYYNFSPIQVSDEEYDLIRKYQKKGSNNTVAVIFKVLAVLTWLGGFIAGIVLGKADWDFSWGIAFAWWGGAFASGMLFMAIAEALQLLSDNKELLSEILEKK